MHAASSQLVLTTGASTRPFVIVTSSATGVPARAASCAPTLAQYASSWLEGLHGVVRPSTVAAYAGRLERHVLPQLGRRRLNEVGIDEILALIGHLRGCGYTDSTIASSFTPLSRLFAHAVRRGVIDINPISKLDRSERPRPGRHERLVLNREEIGRLLKAASPRHRTILATAVLSGLRQGELLGLHWRDVDFDKELIRIRSALNRQRRDAPPKTAHARRDVVLMPALAQSLQQHKAKSPFNQPDDYVFTTRVGTPENQGHLASRVLNPALEGAGLAHLRWHDLRHTYASLLIAGGANITFVSRQLGHSSSQITLSVYAHLLDGEEQAQRTREMLEQMLGPYVASDVADDSIPDQAG